MKNIIILSVFLFCCKDYEFKVFNKIFDYDLVTFEFKNTSKKPIFLFTGNIGSDFKIIDRQNEELIRRTRSTWDPEYSRPEFSYELIQETAKRYGINEWYARKWLEHKNEFTVMKPNEKKIFIIDFDDDTSSYAYELKTNENYFVEGKTIFSTFFVPQKLIDSLTKKNITFAENPSVDYKVKINVDKFFKKECLNEKCYYIK